MATGVHRWSSTSVLVILIIGFELCVAACPPVEQYCTCNDDYSQMQQTVQLRVPSGIKGTQNTKKPSSNLRFVCRSNRRAPELFSLNISNSTARFSCNSMTEGDYAYTDKWAFRELNTAEFHDCPFPKTFNRLSEALQTQQLHSIVFDSSLIDDRDTISGLPSLERVTLTNNTFQSLNPNFLREATNLLVFNASDNTALHLPTKFFSHNTNIREIIIRSNKKPLTLSKGSIANLPKLETIDLRGSGISDLPDDFLLNCPSLKYLYLSDNKISTLRPSVLKNKPQLFSLNIKNNELSVLDSNLFNEIPNVKSIVLSENKITALPDSLFTKNAKLQYLKIASNKISYISDRVFAPLQNVWSLDMSSCGADFPPNAFENMTSLSLLKISGNSWKAIDNFAKEGKFNPFLQYSY